MSGPHQPPTVVNRWRRGVGARVVLELAIVVASSGPFGAPPEDLHVQAKRTRKGINIRQFIRHALTYTARYTAVYLTVYTSSLQRYTFEIISF
jgi:hypothetical protein